MRAEAQSSKAKKIGTLVGVVLFALLFLFLAIFTTADRLISLGIMRQSLSSKTELVRSDAYVTVSAFRALCVILALLITGTGLMWKRILRLPMVARIHAHEVRYSSIRSQILAPFNVSFVIICICLFFTALYMRWGPVWFDPDVLANLEKEDHLIEQLQVLLFFLCSISFLVLSVRLRSPKAYRVMYGLFAFGFFMMAGEEISWGQRIFHIATPEAIQKINVQGEINLHNCFGYLPDHLFGAAVFVYGFIFPMAAHASSFIRKLFDMIGLPLPTIGLAVGFMVTSLIHKWTVGWLISGQYALSYKVNISELRELLAAVAFGLLAFESVRVFKLSKLSFS